MTKVIAVANHKGGVGKTTSVMNVGAILAARGFKTLLIDLDAQANLTISLLGAQPSETIYESIKGSKPMPIVNVSLYLDLVPASLELASVELEMAARMSREFILKKLIEPIRSKYDFILMDCPPSLGLITINALTAADSVYIPLTAEALPAKGLQMLFSIVDQVKEINNELNVGGILLTRYEKSNLSQSIEDGLRETYGNIVFKTRIRKNIAVAEAVLYQQDVSTYQADSNGAKDYQNLVDEIIKRDANDK